MATLVEAANYLPCGDGCSALTDTASAFCFRLGDQVLVGEGRSYLHEGKFSAMEEWTASSFSCDSTGDFCGSGCLMAG